MDYIASVQFFILVSVMLGICTAIASTIPQGLAPSAYEQSFHPTSLTLLRLFSFTDFYTSPLFFLLVGLMEVSLLLCALPRFAARIRRQIRNARSAKGAARRLRLSAYAPDVVHLGLLIVIAEGLVANATRERWEFTGFVNDEFELGDGTIRVTDAGERVSDRGDLAGWYLEVELSGDAESTEPRTVRFGSNRPASSAFGRLHFRNYRPIARAVLVDTSVARGGRELVLTEGEGLVRSTGGAVVLVDIIDGSAVFADLDLVPEAEEDIARAVDRARKFRLTAGESYGSFELAEATRDILVGFAVTRDPTRIPILVGLVIIIGGMVLYAAKRLNKGA